MSTEKQHEVRKLRITLLSYEAQQTIKPTLETQLAITETRCKIVRALCEGLGVSA